MNKRHYKRYLIKCNGCIMDSTLQNVKFKVNNISACGMSITTKKEIADPAHELTIQFDLTGMLLPHSKELKGSVVRQRQNDSVFNYCIRFTDLNNMEIVELDEYLRYTQNNPISIYMIPSDDLDDFAVGLKR